MPKASPIADRLKALPLYLLPHHPISRLVHGISRRQGPLSRAVNRWFARRYGLNMAEAEHTDAGAYPSLNALFTRALRPGARPLAGDDDTVVSPVDGRVSQLGTIDDGRIFQAKGREYSLVELLGGSRGRAEPFRNGRFATIYLAPHDYHRVHMPFPGQVTEMVHVPGRLFSVAPFTVRTVPHLFSRNERVATMVDAGSVSMGLVLVGAINVGSIETVWTGEITPPRRLRPAAWSYDLEGPYLQKGEEMGRFNLGSTVIVLFGPNVEWREDIGPGDRVRMGQALGQRILAG